MPSRFFGNWLQAYLDFSGPTTEAPTDFNFWTGVWAIGGALRRKVFLDMGHFQWVPNFYIFLVAPPGIVSKSTTLNIGASMLREIEAVKFGPEAVTWQALVEALAGAREEVSLEGNVGLKIETVLFPMSCISIAAGELGTLIQPSNREMIDALVSLWDGKQAPWEKWTKTSGRDLIVNPFINIASCTTPSWIAQNFPEELVGGGFISRCLFIYGEKKRELIAYPMDKLPPDFVATRTKLIHDLEIISTLAGRVKLTKDALDYGRSWYDIHNTEMASPETARFATYRARKQTHIHKLAIVLSAAERDDLIVDAKTLEKAKNLVELTEPSLKKVFDAIGLEGAGKRLSLVMQILLSHGKMTKTALFALLCYKMSSEEFDLAVQAGQRANLIKLYTNATDVYVALL